MTPLALIAALFLLCGCTTLPAPDDVEFQSDSRLVSRLDDLDDRFDGDIVFDDAGNVLGGGVIARLAALEASLAMREAEAAALSADVVVLEADVVVLEAEIETLEGDVGDLGIDLTLTNKLAEHLERYALCTHALFGDDTPVLLHQLRTCWFDTGDPS